MNQFTKEYYEDGVRNHISGYEDYRWMPTRSIPEALDIKHHFDNEPCELDEINKTTNKPFASWSEYYEDDGYVADPCFDGIPDTLEIEWVYGANEFLSKSLEKEEA